MQPRSAVTLAVVHVTGNDGDAEDDLAVGNDDIDLPWTHKSHLPSANDST